MQIEIRALHHLYPSGVKALRGIDLQIADRRPLAIIGQNGAGKTTLVKHLNGLLLPTSGDVLIDGADTRTQSTARWSRRVGYIFQNPDDQLFESSVRRELEFGPRRLGMDEIATQSLVEYAAEITGLLDKLETHPHDLPPTWRKLVAIGSIVAMDPELVILDEPTTGQDVRGNQLLAQVVDALVEAGKTLITISHDMRFVAAHFQRVVVMCEGKVILDAPVREAFAQPDILARTFVTPPPMTRLGQRLGFQETVLNVPELIQACERRIEGKRRV